MPVDPAPSPSTSESRGDKVIRVMDAAAISRALRRIAHQIIEHNSEHGTGNLAVVGIHSRGVEVARRLADLITEIEGVHPAFGVLDVSMHRDDYGRRPNLASIKPTDLPIDLDSHTIVLADDVFSTGRTARAAMDALTEYGRPPRIQLAALVDRGHRELPIRPDYVGKNLPTSRKERVLVRFTQTDGEPDAVWLCKDPPC
jgi:pyrimidine operon attenuation protein/uracil phosphoribosyltransferase